jgi:drug/metabolite transporter (DMT)-like permease
VENKWIFIVGLCIASALWGFNFGVSRLGMDTFDAQLFIFLRFGFAVPLLFVILKLREGAVGIRIKDAGLLMILGFFGITMLEMLVMFSIEHTTLANASLLNVAPWPIFVALFSPLFVKEPLTMKVIIGGVLALVGVTMVIVGGQEGIQFTSGQMIGNGAALLVSIIGALMNLSTMRLMHTYSPLRVTTWLIFFGVVFLFPFTWGSWDNVSWATLGALELSIIGYNVILCTVVAFVLWNACMHHVGATVSNFFRYVVPVAAVIAGYVMYDEPLTTWQVIGALFMAAGLLWITLKRKSISIQ